jgi:hypothetical protein
MSKNLRRSSRRAKTELASLPLLEPSQQSTVKESLPGKTTIDQLDQEIAVLKSEVSKLQAKLHDLELQRANYAYQISPLRRIPTEILSEIICLCLYDGEDIIKMAGICSRLREVALGMTTVWSKITLQTVEPIKNYEYSSDSIKGSYGSSPEVCCCHLLSVALRSQKNCKGGIRCTTLEQLKVALTRAGSRALDLDVQWPVERGTLELIGSRHDRIRSINIHATPMHTIDMQHFNNLNMESLNRIGVLGMGCILVEELMDLALQSNCSKIVLGMHGSMVNLQPFRHEIMKRVEHLELSIKSE